MYWSENKLFCSLLYPLHVFKLFVTGDMKKVLPRQQVPTRRADIILANSVATNLVHRLPAQQTRRPVSKENVEPHKSERQTAVSRRLLFDSVFLQLLNCQQLLKIV